MDKKQTEEFEQRQFYLNTITNKYIPNDFKENINDKKIVHNNKSKDYKSGFTIVGIILSVLFVIELLLLIIFSFPFLTIILIAFSNILNISLFFGLGYALKLIHKLQETNKNYKKKN